MKKLIFGLIMAFSTAAWAETEHPPLEDIPPTYDMPEDQFVIDLPMMCTMDGARIFDYLERGGYKIAFLGSTKSQNGGDLYVTVFLHQVDGDYYVLITNKKAGGTCELTSGDYGQVFPLDEFI
jgi:hypothetical protein